MGRAACDGEVESLRGQRVLFTGTTRIDGVHRKREELSRDVSNRGAFPVQGTRNAKVTLLVIGELHPDVVTDPINVRSQNAVYVDGQRASGNHICIVDDFGISSLLRREPAPCLRTRIVQDDLVEFSPPRPKQQPSPVLTPLARRTVPVHDLTGLGLGLGLGLDLDLSRLDRGTAVHEMTIDLLRVSLSPVPLEALSRPRVDAVWRHHQDPATLFVAEVKSLTGARQEQQIRLGIGQVLDYTHAVRTDPPVGISTAKPVLVLEREPDDPRWSDLCAALGILLTWPPDFPRVG